MSVATFSIRKISSRLWGTPTALSACAHRRLAIRPMHPVWFTIGALPLSLYITLFTSIWLRTKLGLSEIFSKNYERTFDVARVVSREKRKPTAAGGCYF